VWSRFPPGLSLFPIYTVAAQPKLGEVWIVVIARLEIDLEKVNWVEDG